MRGYQRGRGGQNRATSNGRPVREKTNFARNMIGPAPDLDDLQSLMDWDP